nr:unnamed protein product [Callosobruchus chinensis]
MSLLRRGIGANVVFFVPDRIANEIQVITELAPAQLKTHIKAAEVEFLLKLHKDKPMHGIFYKLLEEHGLSQQLTFSFLRSSGLKSETEGFIMACQDGVFNTLVYRSRVMGVNVPDARCRACRQAPETLMHLLSACRTYAGTAYIHRHNAALRVLYYHLRHSYGIDETPRCRIYWNYLLPTLELVQANKPDIVLLHHQQKTMFVIEFSAPAEVNIVSKEEEKRTKYQELSQWARAHQDWLLPQWRNVLFPDESRFGLASDDYRERVWRER